VKAGSAARARELRLAEPERWVRAHVVPFALFMAGLLVLLLFGSFFQDENPARSWWRRAPEHWVYALQTLACLGAIGWWWRRYEFDWSWRWSLVGAGFGAIGIGLWILPTASYEWLGLEEDPEGVLGWLGVAARREGFDPAGDFGEGSVGYWLAVGSRFLRAVVTVALIEEIFWRGYLMRLVLDWDGDYWKQPFGKPSWLSFAVVTGGFALAHAPVDYAGALAYGALTYGFCVWSRNLGGCVIMHAVANLLMGVYAMSAGKAGLW